MSLGVIMLVHTDFDRAEQLVRHWADAGCPVVVHVDSNVAQATYDGFEKSLADVADVRFSARHRCEWGTWGLVAASQEAATLLLEDFPDVQHAFLASGACLPLRPIADLKRYLDAHPDTDFIESATTADVPWTVGGLDRERFTLYFPFAWKKHRRIFDAFVRIQQMLRYRRSIPEGITPHMGSQWWCLTRQTLDAILRDPNRRSYDAYFQKVWIPDESYYQTLTRLHTRKVESRSLTLAKFDYQGKPHIFFDDHAELLQRSKSFVARKIWRDADQLYHKFPLPVDPVSADDEPVSGAVDRVFSQAVERRTLGRPGLYMHSRFPSIDRQTNIAAAPYAVLQGLDDIFPEFQAWLTRQTGAQVHGHLFAKDRAHFADDSEVYRGGLSDNARLRDYHGKMFLTNLIWNGRDEHHCFQFGPADTQEIRWTLAKDTNASIWVVSGAWSIPLFASGRSASDVRAEAARLQRIEDKFLKVLRSPDARARIRIMTLSQFIEAPMDVLQTIIDEIAGHRGNALKEVPQMADLTGLPDFLQDLKNQGMHPFLTGDITDGNTQPTRSLPRRKPYVISGK
ncbi:MAG: beta-1,6-N-acetylglucosaminyltransferase [Pseudomonadota bacterium]